MKRILIVGATSAIAEATARVFAQKGAAFFLAARGAERVRAIADDLRIRGAGQVEVKVFDARDAASYRQLVDESANALGGLDAALIAHGTLSNQRECEASAESLYQEFQVNALSVMGLCTHLANYFEAQGSGVIAVISSVAGDRGRGSNYVYGSSKAAVTAFTSGLRQRLHAKGVSVVTIKPGFVDTPMTAAFKKSMIWASPAAVAAAIVRAMARRTPVLYVPWFWRPIMWIVCAIPERVFRKLQL
jgi:short-subunit dehydrogenase